MTGNQHEVESGGTALPGELVTGRLWLRRPREIDAEELAVIFADQQVMRWVGGGTLTGPQTRAAVISAMLLWRLQGLGLYTLVKSATGEIIGRAGLTARLPYSLARSRRRQPAGRELELGIVLCRQAWGFGYGREALTAVARVAWQLPWRPSRLLYLTVPDNLAATRLAYSLGMIRIGNAVVDSGLWQIYELRRPR